MNTSPAYKTNSYFNTHHMLNIPHIFPMPIFVLFPTIANTTKIFTCIIIITVQCTIQDSVQTSPTTYSTITNYFCHWCFIALITRQESPPFKRVEGYQFIDSFKFLLNLLDKNEMVFNFLTQNSHTKKHYAITK